jgi:hypothetical protein
MGKLRTMQTASLPLSRHTTNSNSGGAGGGGSLRLKLLSNRKHKGSSSVQVLDQHDRLSQQAALNPKGDTEKGADTTAFQTALSERASNRAKSEPKSVSLQALANNSVSSSTGGGREGAMGATSIGTNASSVGGAVVGPDQKCWSIAEKIGGRISMDLANGGSPAGSGRGSRSSGMQVC